MFSRKYKHLVPSSHNYFLALIQLAVKAKAIWNEGPKDARVVFTFDPENIEFPSIGDQRGLTQWVDVFDSG